MLPMAVIRFSVGELGVEPGSRKEDSACSAGDVRMSSRAMMKWIAAILLITTAAVAQQTHNQYEPANAPGAGQKLLAQFAGEWDVLKTFYPMNGQPIVTKGTCKQYPDPGRQVPAVRFHVLQF
jgi:hypothetical protein